MNAQRIPDITLERYLLKELPAEQMKLTGELIQSDPALRKRVDEITASDKKILRRYAPETMTRRIRERSSRREQPGAQAPARRPYWMQFLVPSLAAAAVVSLFILVPLIRTGYDTVSDPSLNDVTRIKGAPAKIFVYRKTGSNAELLGNNRRVREKDLLQIAYYSAEDSHGVILSLDGRGTVTLHYPAPPSTGTRIEKNREILLPRAYELDDAPAFERFILVTSGSPLDVRAVCRAAEQLAKKPGRAKKGELTIDSRNRQTSLVLLKE